MIRPAHTLPFAAILVVGVLFPAGLSHAQEGRAAEGPPIHKHEDLAATDLYAIRLERLRQEILANRDALLPSELEDLAGLLREADSALAAGDLEEASGALLQAEVTLEMILQADEGGVDAPSEPGVQFGRWSATWAAIAGADAWQEQIARIEERTEGFKAGEFDPYVGLRGSLMGDLSGISVSQYVEARLSPDYSLVIADGGINALPSGLGRVDLSHRLSLTRYRDPQWNDFWQADLEGRWEPVVVGASSFGPRFRLLRTRFMKGETGDLFLSYRQVEWGFGGSLYPVRGATVGAVWLQSRRRYDEAPTYDFRDSELRISASVYGSNRSMTLWGVFLDRRFDEGTGGASYIAVNYQEVYLDLRTQWRFVGSWGVDLRSSWERRNYAVDDPVIPDYHEYVARVGILWQPDYHTSVSVGPLVHARKSLLPRATFEDFSTVGVSLEVDLYRGQQWSLQLSTSFESRDYRDDLSAVTPALALYGDRDILDHTLLFTWHLEGGWEFSATANWSREDDRHWRAQDVQSSLLSVQISRFF